MKWYTYVSLKDFKEGNAGSQFFYAVVDEIVDRNEECSHLRVWDESASVVIKLLGPFASTINKGDVVRVHRIKRQDQGDSYETSGYGEPGKMTQMVVWRENESGEEGYSMVASSSGDKYTRNDNDIEVVNKLHRSWKSRVVCEEVGVSSDGEVSGEEEDGNLDVLDAILDNTVMRDPNESASMPVNEAADTSHALNECSLNVDSIMAENRLDSLLDGTVQDEEREESIPAPPPLTDDQRRRLQRAVPLSDLREYTYYDVLLQVVEAYYEMMPSAHVIVRCWDPQSTIPTYQKPLRSHARSEDYMDRTIIKPVESIVNMSRGRTVDIYCYEYDIHAGPDGRNFMSGDWLLFCNLKVGFPRHALDTILSMHEGGVNYGRCIRRVNPNLYGAKTPASCMVTEKVRKEIIEKEQLVATATEKRVEKSPKKNRNVRFDGVESSENESLTPPVHSFRKFNKKRNCNSFPPRSPIKSDNEVMIPRCKTIQPYFMWEKQVVPDNAIEDPLNECIQLLSRVNCNCGAPLTQGENECPRPLNDSKRHEYFYRNKITSAPLCEPSTSESGKITMKNEILPSLSCISQRGMPTLFDLVVQMSHLSVEKCKLTRGIPRCHISVWDGTIPPDSLGSGKLLRDLTTDADKIVVGSSPQLDLISLRTIDIRLANVRKVKVGEFVILRDVTIVRAFSIGTDEGSLNTVWMLQARDMEVINKELAKDPEISKASMGVATRISTVILNIEGGDEDEEEEIVEGGGKKGAKRKTENQINPKRSKRIRLDESTDITWMDELAEKNEIGMESQEDRTFNLKSALGSIVAPRTTFNTLAFNAKIYDYFMESLAEEKILPKKVWMCWMKTCLSFNTIKERKQQEGCCEKCDGQISLFVYIPIENPMDSEKSLHLLIDVSHFREGKTRISWSKWKKYSVKAMALDMKRIADKINVSTISVRRVTMMHLQSMIVFVVSNGNEWLTVTNRSS